MTRSVPDTASTEEVASSPVTCASVRGARALSPEAGPRWCRRLVGSPLRCHPRPPRGRHTRRRSGITRPTRIGRRAPRRSSPSSPPGRGCGGPRRRRTRRGRRTRRRRTTTTRYPRSTASMARPTIPRLRDTPVATTVETPRARRVGSSEVPTKGDTPWARCETRSSGAGPSSGTSSTAGVPSTRCSGRRSIAAMSGALGGDPRRSGRNPAVQCTTGTPAAARCVEQARRVGDHADVARRRGQLGEARQVAHHAPLQLHGEHGRPTAADELGQRDGHVQRVTRAGVNPPATAT